MVFNWVKKLTEAKQDKNKVKDKPIKKSSTKSPPIKKSARQQVASPQSEKNSALFNNLFSGLNKSSVKISDNLKGVFTKRKLDAKAIQDLEDILIMSDIGVELAQQFSQKLAQNRFEKEITDTEVKQFLAEEITQILQPISKPLKLSQSPHIILMVGVNGSGKTTTIAKLAQQYSDSGKKVILGAGDTFRAAAVEQLKIWGERIGCDVISKNEGADSGALAYETVETALKHKADVVIIDTAGRLHNKEHLMEELKKIHRVIGKVIPDAPSDVVLVLDATVGQNALEQVNHFKQAVDITGIMMTKLDGTAKGGVLVNIAHKYSIPIYAVGVGESVNDLNSFTAQDFAKSLMGI